MTNISIGTHTVSEKLVSDLTISELKVLIKETIAEEMLKYYYTLPTYSQPCYQFTYPWDDRNKVWCSSDTKSSIKIQDVVATTSTEQNSFIN